MSDKRDRDNVVELTVAGTGAPRDVTNACVEVPVEVSGVIGVSALTNKVARASYSSYGVGVTDVSAPGSSVYSTYPGARYTRMSGTSMASPHVAGVAALIVSQFPGIQPGAVEAMIQNTADGQPCPACQGDVDYNGFFGHGQINALTAGQISPQGISNNCGRRGMRVPRTHLSFVGRPAG